MKSAKYFSRAAVYTPAVSTKSGPRLTRSLDSYPLPFIIFHSLLDFFGEPPTPLAHVPIGTDHDKPTGVIAVRGSENEPCSGDERRLIERAREDPAALSELYRQHVQRIDQYVTRRVGRTPDAEDIVANVFLAFVKSVTRSHLVHMGDKPLIHWLYRVATNEINRWLRRRRILRFLHLTTEDEITVY